MSHLGFFVAVEEKRRVLNGGVRSFENVPQCRRALKAGEQQDIVGVEGERCVCVCVCWLTDTLALAGDISPAGRYTTFISILQLAYLFMASLVFTAQNKWLVWHSTSLHIINTGNKSSLSRLLPTKPSSDPPPLTAGSTSRPLSSQRSYTRHMWISEVQLILRVDWKFIIKQKNVIILWQRVNRECREHSSLWELCCRTHGVLFDELINCVTQSELEITAICFGFTAVAGGKLSFH